MSTLAQQYEREQYRTIRRGQWKQMLTLAVAYVLLTAGAISALIPFIWMVSTSFKTMAQVFRFPPEWIPSPLIFDNYVRAWTLVPFGQFIINSAKVTVLVTLGQLLSCSMAAYAFARLRWPGRDVVFLGYLATMMIPGQVTMIPTFILIKYLGLIDTLEALIIPGFLGSAFGTFLLRQFFLTIPGELEDAARIDGASHVRIFSTIILPLSKPALATLAVFTFMYHWNNFLWPVILINSPEKKTLPIGLASLQGYYFTEWPVLMAGAVMSLIPMLLVFFSAQRYFVEGITLTGLKG